MKKKINTPFGKLQVKLNNQPIDFRVIKKILLSKQNREKDKNIFY